MSLDTRLRDLVARAYEHALTFRRIMDEAGLEPSDVQSAADLAKIRSRQRQAGRFPAGKPAVWWLAHG
jgi:phenylacetate-coenzyme A ligase PaaK-like adenylate-forming protein